MGCPLYELQPRLHQLTELAMSFASRLNGDKASRTAFALEPHTLTQDEADHVLPIMAAYGGILNAVKGELAEEKRKHPDSEDGVRS